MWQPGHSAARVAWVQRKSRAERDVGRSMVALGRIREDHTELPRFRPCRRPLQLSKLLSWQQGFKGFGVKTLEALKVADVKLHSSHVGAVGASKRSVGRQEAAGMLDGQGVSEGTQRQPLNF